MAVLRVTANLFAEEFSTIAAFHRDVIGLGPLFDMGSIATLNGEARGPAQVTLAREGGSGTELSAISIKGDNFADVLVRARATGAESAHGPVDEPLAGHRRFLRDPAAHPVNIMTHID